MAYWGYMDFIKSVMAGKSPGPRILEIGVNKGQMFVPLLSHLTANFEYFSLVGIDILKRDAISVQLQLMSEDLVEGKQEVYFYEQSSLEVLPTLVEYMKETNQEEDGLFDVILIDGDHNYYTVKRELECVPSLLKRQGIIILDDYSNKWGTKDEYFSELEDYKGNKHATPREGTEHPEKKGIVPAVSEFLEANKEWILTNKVHDDHEPVLLFRRGELVLFHEVTGKEFTDDEIDLLKQEPEEKEEEVEENE
jgi:predicted O-methyltransferase YrrM